MRKKKLVIFASYIIYFSIVFGTCVQAGIFSGGFSSGILTYGVGGGSASIATTAASQWNGHSSKVNLTRSYSTDTYGLSANIITYCESHPAPTSGSLGQMYPYKTWGLSASAAANNEIWVKAVVYQYINTMHTATASKIATATHEFGHCLGIKHPDSVWDAPDAIMVPGLHTTYTLDPEYDIKQLRLKWGY